MLRFTLSTIVASLLSFSAVAEVAAHGDLDDLAQLRQARGAIVARTAGSRPGANRHLFARRRHLDRLIAALEDGRPVMASVVDRALGRERPPSSLGAPSSR